MQLLPIPASAGQTKEWGSDERPLLATCSFQGLHRRRETILRDGFGQCKLFSFRSWAAKNGNRPSVFSAGSRYAIARCRSNPGGFSAPTGTATYKAPPGGCALGAEAAIRYLAAHSAVVLCTARTSLGVVHLAAGKNVGATEHVGKSVAFDHEYFHSAWSVPQQHYRRRLSHRYRCRLIDRFHFHPQFLPAR